MQPALLADWLRDGVWHEPPTAAGILSFTPVIMRRLLSQSDPLMLQHSSRRQQQSHFERLLGNPHYGRGAHGLLSDSHQQMVRSQSTVLLAPTPPLPLSAPSSLRLQSQPPEPAAADDVHVTMAMPAAEVAAASAALKSLMKDDEGPQQQHQCQQQKYSAAVAAAAVAMAAVAAAAAVAVLPMSALPPLMQEMQVTRPAARGGESPCQFAHMRQTFSQSHFSGHR